jgi:MFS transporter, AAHS family, 3-hydroxyphenylpropionic acid transporter
MNTIDRPRLALVLCAAAAIVEGFDVQSMGVAAPRVIAEFALGPSQSGVLFSAATFGLFIGAVVGGRISDHVGRKRVLIFSMLLFGLCSLLTASARDYSILVASRVLTGLGLGGSMPNFIAVAAEATHPRRRLGTMTLIMAGMPMGGTVAALVSLQGAWAGGWRTIFYVGAVAPLLLALVMMRYLSEQRAAPHPSGAMEKPQVESMAHALFGSGRCSMTVLLWIGFFFTQVVLLLMLNWLPSLMVGLGFSRSQAGWASVCFGLGGSLGAIILGRLHAGKRRRLWVLLTYAGMAVALAALATLEAGFPVSALACALAGGFIIGAQLILFSLAPLYYPCSIRGTGVGAAVAVGRLGSVLGPLFAGTVLARGGNSTSVLLAVVPFVLAGGAASFALTWRPQCPD